MTERELDAKCARILGWTGIAHVERDENWDVGGFSGAAWQIIPHYSTDLNASRELLEWIPPNGKRKFMEELLSRTEIIRSEEMTHQWKLGWACMLATPRQIASAFYECFGGEK